ncbi:MAG: hypothetical protein IJN32_09275, partial [Thermoguttaceae bacterium]|nr:hypothetical protein [Thermoguttaceae bacterium]
TAPFPYSPQTNAEREKNAAARRNRPVPLFTQTNAERDKKTPPLENSNDGVSLPGSLNAD